MEDVGPGVYLMEPKDAKGIPCRPGTFGVDNIRLAMESMRDTFIVEAIISFSRLKGEWCGMSLPRLFDEVCRMVNPIEVRRAIREMVSAGLLVVREPETIWRMLTFRATRNIICPTPKLIGLILSKAVESATN